MSDNLGQKPTFENLIAQARDMGWDFFHGPGGLGSAARPAGPDSRQERMSAIASALYEADEFRELLAFLAENTLHRQTFVTPFVGVDPMQGYCYGVFREGQNSMLMSIFKLIAQGRDQQIKGRE